MCEKKSLRQWRLCCPRRSLCTGYSCLQVPETQHGLYLASSKIPAKTVNTNGFIPKNGTWVYSGALISTPRSYWRQWQWCQFWCQNFLILVVCITTRRFRIFRIFMSNNPFERVADWPSFGECVSNIRKKPLGLILVPKISTSCTIMSNFMPKRGYLIKICYVDFVQFWLEWAQKTILFCPWLFWVGDQSCESQLPKNF